MDNLTAADLFSPSKALQQRAQAQDWAQIESWLSYKYIGRTIPTFERNEDTLRILRELSLANERADEERAVYERLEREALKELDEISSQQNEDDKTVLETLKSHLTPTGSSSLEALASTAVTLNTPSANPETIAHTLVQHTSTSQTLSNNLAHIDTLQAYLEKQHALLRTQLTELKTNPSFQTPPELPRQTTEYVRQNKHLRNKIKEAEDKLSNLQHSSTSQSRGRSASVRSPAVGLTSSESLSEMLEQQKGLNDLKARVEGLEKQVDEYAGLPADREQARREVNKLEVELDGVRRRRDGLFEGLVGR